VPVGVYANNLLILVHSKNEKTTDQLFPLEKKFRVKTGQVSDL